MTTSGPDAVANLLPGTGDFAVLLVEDDPGDQRLMETLLDEAGVARDQIYPVADLQSAIALGVRSVFSVILLDLDLPDSAGLETLTRMRAALPGIPVVIMTGQQNDRVACAAVQEGAQDFLIKGRVDCWTLTRTLRFAIERHRLLMAVEAARIGASHRATHDPLTGLPNRALFEDRISHAAARAARRKSLLAVVLFDLDQFKPVNDRFGHAAGDAVLIEVGRRLSARVRGSDTVARLGGDEFVVLFEDVIDQPTVLNLAHQMRRSLALQIRLPGGACRVGASLGVAFYPEEDLAIASLMHRADTRMYADKAERNSSPTDGNRPFRESTTQVSAPDSDRTIAP
jgi:diguanylate cyclase (GGDEF)-like protein